MPFPVIRLTSKKLAAVYERYSGFPGKLGEAMRLTMDAVMLSLWESVPPYPNVPNPTRTGTLGRTLGSSPAGGRAFGEPQIYEVRDLGAGRLQGKFGTRLGYAALVIGEGTQAWMHYRWWTIKTVAKNAAGKIGRLWENLGARMADYLEGR